MSLLLATFLASLAALAHGKPGYGPGEQDWGYVDVRPGAHMFYWLYYTTANVSDYTERPLAIWLQGGPGSSSTGVGNFAELGPVDLDGNLRNWTWVKDMNVLFIDSPVGSGYSYVDNTALYTTTNKEIALDLVELMKGFYKLHPEFGAVPLHIFSESYGGKMAPEFALELYYAKERGEVKSNLTSVALGNPSTSPIDSILAMGPFLRELGIVDHEGYRAIQEAANLMAQLVEQEKWIEAIAQSDNTAEVIGNASKCMDVYNVVRKTALDVCQMPLTLRPEGQFLHKLMQGPVAKTLGIPSNVLWGSQSEPTNDKLETDLLKPAIHIVNELLEKTPLKVGVYSGSLDLMCSTPGTLNWIAKLNWSRRDEYLAAPRNAIIVNRILEGYQKTGGNFTMFWINRSGHMVPIDNPAAMSHVLRNFTTFG